jgi:hypothetical protein
MDVHFLCLLGCVGSGLCDELISSAEKSYRCVCVCVYVCVCVCVCVCLILCALETSKMRRPRPDLGCCTTEKNTRIYFKGIRIETAVT